MSKNTRNNRFSRVKINVNGYDWVLISTLFLLVVLGLTFFASSLTAPSREVYFQEFSKQLLLGIVFGSVVAFFLSQFDYNNLIKLSPLLIVINFFLLGFLAFFAVYISLSTWGGTPTEVNNFRLSLVNSLRGLPIRPHAANGAIRWISVSFLPNFQPSEFTKIALLLFLAFSVKKIEKLESAWYSLKQPLYALLLSSFLILIQPDLGTVVLIFITFLSALWVAKVDLKLISIVAVVAFFVFMLLTVSEGYRLNRVLAVIDPTRSVATDQIRGVQVAISNGGLLGVGYGESEYKRQVGILYEESTDAIIAIIAEEMGFVVTVLFLSLYLIFLWRGIKIAREAPNLEGRVLATGITVWIVLQALLNITGITGITPLTGIPLPYVSKGGTAMVVNLAIAGILLNISKQGRSDTFLPLNKVKQ